MSSGSMRSLVVGVDQKYGVFRMAKFGMAQLIGFLIAEGVLALSLMSYYHNFWVPQDSYSSPLLIGLNLLAFVVGVAVAFCINEMVNIRVQAHGAQGRASGVFFRFLKYQAVNGAGKPIILVVELVLLALLGVSPVLGLMVGAMICYPVMYLASMHFVWQSHTTVS